MAIDPTQDSPDAVAARADARADRSAAGAIADFFLDASGRLDERTRILLDRALAAVVAGLDRAIRHHAARLLSQLGDDAAAERLLGIREDVSRWLSRPGALPAAVIDELIGRVRHDRLAEALPIEPGEPDRPSLLVRLSGAPDPVIAAAAVALLSAETRRREEPEGDSGLPAELHHRLAWRVAAALRTLAGADPGLDGALVEATRRTIAAHDEGERPEAVAMRLAAAIEVRAAERGPLMLETIGDRRLTLFTALLAHALGLDFAPVRALIVDPHDERLWLALRGAELDRATIARVALALSDADPRRDIEAFADRLDVIAELAPADATTALANLALPHDYRMAIRRVASR